MLFGFGKAESPLVQHRERGRSENRQSACRWPRFIGFSDRIIAEKYLFEQVIRERSSRATIDLAIECFGKTARAPRVP